VFASEKRKEMGRELEKFRKGIDDVWNGSRENRKKIVMDE